MPDTEIKAGLNPFELTLWAARSIKNSETDVIDTLITLGYHPTIITLVLGSIDDNGNITCRSHLRPSVTVVNGVATNDLELHGVPIDIEDLDVVEK